jgi:tRNA(fMet)-specific endonuclease VapC
MLDTDICSYLMRDNPPTLHKKFADHRDGLCISSITFAELLYGAERKSSPKLLAQILRFVGILNVIEWDSEAARAYAVLRSRQESLGLPIDNMDMLIAASAMSRGYTLVSNNAKHFSRIKDLNFETGLPLQESLPLAREALTLRRVSPAKAQILLLGPAGVNLPSCPIAGDIPVSLRLLVMLLLPKP